MSPPVRSGRAPGAATALLAAAAVVVGLVGVLGAPAPATAETRPRYGRALVGSLLGRPTTFDPVEARSHAEVQLALLLYDSLYQLSDTGEALPHLAVGRPTVSADGLEARIRLRRGVLFHDGSALGPADVIASLERLRSSRAGWLLATVASINAPGPFGGAGAGTLAGTGAGDEIVLRLTRPTPELVELLAAPAASITPGGKPPRRLPVGSGPFAMKRAPRPTGLTLEAWAQHFGGRPYADRLELSWFSGATDEAQAYEIGELNLSFRGPVAFTGHQPKYATQVSSGPAAVLAYVGFGRAHGRAFDSRDLRRALSLALGRDALRHIGTGERVLPTTLPLAIDLGGREPRREDLLARTDAARAALARATGAAAGLANRRVTLDLLVDRTRPDDREIGERVVGALFQLGVSARIVELDAGALVARVARGECDLYVGQLVPPGPSASSQIAAAFAAGGDPWAGSQLAAGPLDVEAALAAFGERLPVLPLFHRAVRVHHRVDVRQVWFDATGRLFYASMHLFGGY